MPFWSSKPHIPDNLAKGGLLSTYGGYPAVVQYRVWVKTADGKHFYHAEEEFQGIMIAWRRFQQNLDYYTAIGLPVAVVWDQGLRGYREVDLDTMLPWLKREAADWYEIVKKRQKERAEQEKAAEAEKLQKAALEGMEHLPGYEAPAPEVKAKKGRKGKEPYVPELTTSLQQEEYREQQKVARELEARAEKAKQEETEEQNPRKHKKRNPDDPTEEYRKGLISQMRSQQESDDPLVERKRLEAKYGRVWNTEELTRDFDVLGFMAPFVSVMEEATGRKGTLMFQDYPRFYFNFRPVPRRLPFELPRPGGKNPERYPTSYLAQRRFIIDDIVRYLSPNLPPVAVKELKKDLRFQSLRYLIKFWSDVRMKNPGKRPTPITLGELMKPSIIKCARCGGDLHVIPYKKDLGKGRFTIETINICGRCTLGRR